MKKYKHSKLENLVNEPGAMAYINISREGLALNYLKAFMEYSKITLRELASVFHVSERTLQRYQADDKLPIGPSEKLISLTKLYEKGAEVLGSPALFREWMHTSNMALGGAKPMDLLDTHMGFELVQDALGRIEHGIYS